MKKLKDFIIFMMGMCGKTLSVYIYNGIINMGSELFSEIFVLVVVALAIWKWDSEDK